MTRNQRSYGYARIAALAAVIFLSGAFLVDFLPRSFGEGWNTFSDAQALAAKSGKNIFVDVYADWCLPCREMDKNVYSDSKIRQYLDSIFVRSKVNFDDPEGRSFKTKYGINAIPVILIVDSKGEEWKRNVGYVHPFVFLRWCAEREYEVLQTMLTPEQGLKQAVSEKKNMALVATKDGSRTDVIGRILKTPGVQSLIDSRYVGSFLMSVHTDASKTMEKFSIEKNMLDDILGIVVIISPDGKQVARMTLTQDLLTDTTVLTDFLTTNNTINE